MFGQIQPKFRSVKDSNKRDEYVMIKASQLGTIISQAVQTALDQVMPFIDHQSLVQEISFTETCRILGYSTINSLTHLKTKGKKMADGNYYKLIPVEGRKAYKLTEVMDFKALQKRLEDEFGNGH